MNEWKEFVHMLPVLVVLHINSTQKILIESKKKLNSDRITVYWTFGEMKWTAGEKAIVDWA
jgi:hypothetical protein